MKGSTLHRSSLTKERMGVLANHVGQSDKKQTAKMQLNQYYRATKAQELDLLWGGVQKGIQKVHNVARATQQKSPAVYLLIGFVAGVLFMSFIIMIVSICSALPKSATKINAKKNVAIIGEDTVMSANAVSFSQEKYIVKKGDTLNGIAYRFYGKHDQAKILEIQRINNIINPQAMRIGQELLIPVMQER